MALLLSFTPLTTLSPFTSSSLSSTIAIYAAPISKLPLKPKSSLAFQIVTPLTKNKRNASIVRVSSETDGAGPLEGGEPPSESEKAVVPVDQLPLESKEKERMEAKERMKLAKKLRLRRRRLVRKRKLRKKGRWPPSKMKKLKNV